MNRKEKQIEVDLRSLSGATGDGIGASDGEVQEHGGANELTDRGDVPSLEGRDNLTVAQGEAGAIGAPASEVWDWHWREPF